MRSLTSSGNAGDDETKPATILSFTFVSVRGGMECFFSKEGRPSSSIDNKIEDVLTSLSKNLCCVEFCWFIWLLCFFLMVTRARIFLSFLSLMDLVMLLSRPYHLRKAPQEFMAGTTVRQFETNRHQTMAYNVLLVKQTT